MGKPPERRIGSTSSALSGSGTSSQKRVRGKSGGHFPEQRDGDGGDKTELVNL